jgi:CHASE2 domain-containing sensor protein
VEYLTPDLVENKTILVGVLRDSLITPMNEWYGHEGIRGDMSDAQISANIISTINRNEFINDVHPFWRVSIILLIGLLSTALLRLFRTRRDVLNIILGLLVFIVLNGLSSGLIVLAFAKDYYLDLDEMTAVLLISAIVSVYWNTTRAKTPTQNRVYVP